MDYISSRDFKKAVKENKAIKARIRKTVVAAATQLSARQLKFTVSSDAIDRDWDKVIQSGWALDNYRLNPVVLWGHDASQLPVGKAVSIEMEGGDLVAVVEFATADMNPMAEQVFQYCSKGYLNATSVGFNVIDWEFPEDEDRDRRGGVDFIKQELLEFSIVSIPSNPEALIHDAIEETEPEEEEKDDSEELDDGEGTEEDAPITPAESEPEPKSINNLNTAKIRRLMKLRILELKN